MSRKYLATIVSILILVSFAIFLNYQEDLKGQRDYPQVVDENVVLTGDVSWTGDSTVFKTVDTGNSTIPIYGGGPQIDEASNTTYRLEGDMVRYKQNYYEASSFSKVVRTGINITDYRRLE